MAETIELGVRDFIAQNFMYREGMKELADDQSLLEQGLIDSTGVLELVFFLEKTFAIKVADDEVTPDNLDSVQQIAEFVRRKRTPANAAAIA